ncbi:uncharacterized protein VTP21DRAFT_1576 [Calcarisporiella thermophila]|uniref:uncharacterized protein n=1 Tax=Calcarisporiella thermophila TaxID=911321 RepID=UPI00374480F6
MAKSFSSQDNMLPFIRLLPHFVDTPGFHFEPVEKQVPQGTILRIGRFTERARLQNSNFIMFKSKVVSRSHAEIWSEQGNFYIRDAGSSSGTFLNHVRLSQPKVESRPFPLRDGDIVRLGIDYQGGCEELYRCVMIRIEIRRSCQVQLDAFKITQYQNLLKQMDVTNLVPPNSITPNSPTNGNATTAECCICLYAIGPLQALFIAPCSHAFHFKCIRPLISHHPSFLCPLCRAYANLDANVEVAELWENAFENCTNLRRALTKEVQPVNNRQPSSATAETNIAESVNTASSTELALEPTKNIPAVLPLLPTSEISSSAADLEYKCVSPEVGDVLSEDEMENIAADRTIGVITLADKLSATAVSSAPSSSGAVGGHPKDIAIHTQGRAEPPLIASPSSACTVLGTLGERDTNILNATTGADYQPVIRSRAPSSSGNRIVFHHRSASTNTNGIETIFEPQTSERGWPRPPDETICETALVE